MAAPIPGSFRACEVLCVMGFRRQGGPVASRSGSGDVAGFVVWAVAAKLTASRPACMARKRIYATPIAAPRSSHAWTGEGRRTGSGLFRTARLTACRITQCIRDAVRPSTQLPCPTPFGAITARLLSENELV